jgi:hypothetical protein
MVMATDFCSSGVLVRSLLLVKPNDGTTGTSNSDVSSTPTVFLSVLFLVSLMFCTLRKKARPIHLTDGGAPVVLSFDY